MHNSGTASNRREPSHGWEETAMGTKITSLQGDDAGGAERAREEVLEREECVQNLRLVE